MMIAESQRRFDVLVIGGGPAGMAAAARAAECGLRVGIVDDNPNLGGQIWRSGIEDQEKVETKPRASHWVNRVRAAAVTLLTGLRIVQKLEDRTLLAEGMLPDGTNRSCELQYDKLILATGARERFLPFPGWTLPNVLGVGGLQAMVKSGLPIAGKRIVVAGTGPLLLAVAAYLHEHGANVLMICEQASRGSLAKFAAQLTRWPSKIAQGFQLKRQLAGIPLAPSSWPLAAHGRKKLESVTISHAGKTEDIACDYLACGFHLVPNLELPSLLGCAIVKSRVQVNDFQETIVSSVFCAGEPTGIGGVESALVEGQIAGLAAAGRITEAKKSFSERESTRRFASLLDSTFRLRCELRSLPAPETLICRCEDVSYARLREHTSWRSAKLHTRCGMGPCQGRVCGPATQFLFKWTPDSIRPPVFPARVETLATAGQTH
jgi:D-hydroxyproline dehydrogenase subunit alpha